MRPVAHLTVRLAFLFAWLFLPLTALAQQTRAGLVLHDVHVFDAIRARFSDPTDVVIRGGVIEKVGAAQRSDAGTRIDGQGAYLLPAFWDSHVHLSLATVLGGDTARRRPRVLAPVAGGDSSAQVLKGFVEHGVLYVRDVGGPLNVISHMHADVQSGRLIGPDIFFAGPLAEHSPLYWEARNAILPGATVPVDRTGQVDSLVASVAAAGGSLLKAFGKWDLQLLRRFIADGRQHGLPVVLDPAPDWNQHETSVPVDTALALGIASIEHANSPWEAALRKPLRDSLSVLNASLKPGDPARRAFSQSIISLGSASLDLDILRKLADTMKQQRVAFTPTLRMWPVCQRITALPPAQRPKSAAGRCDGMQTITRVLASAGVTLLVGQDGSDPAGTADEMSVLASIGIPAATILQAATINAASWLGRADHLGSIEPGKRADLVLLTQNPLESIAAVRTPWLVIKDGVVVFERR